MRPARTHVRRAFALLLASCLLLCQMPAVAFADADQGGAHKDVTPSVVESEAGQDGLPYASDGDAGRADGEGTAVASGDAKDADVQRGSADGDGAADRSDGESANPDEAAKPEKADEAEPEKPAEPASAAKGVEVRPAFAQSRTAGGVTVRVSAPEGVFPDGAELSVVAVPDTQVETAVAAERDDNVNVAVSYTFDIKIMKDGQECQPGENQTVTVSFAMAQASDQNLDATIYHIEDGTADALDTIAAGGEVSAETDGFSIYTVEFTYNNLEYVLPGNTSVPLFEILTAVGLAGEAADVQCSDASLFSASRESGEWVVTAHRAFTSTEWMRVTIGGVVYEIAVTDEVEASGTCGKDGDNVTWTLSDDGKLTISGTGEMADYAVYKYDPPWFESAIRSSISSVVIEDGVTAVGESAFYKCENLTSVTLPTTLTSIGAYSFHSCSSLTSLDIPEGVTSIGEYAFKGSKLKNITIPDGVTLIKVCTFEDCTNLQTVTIPGSVKRIAADPDATYFAFKGCNNLKTVNFVGTEDQWSSVANIGLFSDDVVINFLCHSITVNDGTADKETAAAGETVRITADDPEEGYCWVGWDLTDGVEFEQSDAATTTFTMPDHDVTVHAVFREIKLKDLDARVYTGEAHEPKFGLFGVSLEGKDGIFQEGVDYDISYKNNVDAGTATATVTFKGHWKGSKSATFEIIPAFISMANVEGIDQVYTGKSLTPAAKVTFNGSTLVEDVDYTLSTEDFKVGSGILTVAGIGNFQGTTTGLFRIKPAPITITAASDAKVYDGHALTNDGYTLTGELVEDDVIKSIDVVGAQTTVGTSENVPSNAVIVNTPGDDVTSNYDISYVNGTLEVTKAPLTITANDQTYTYNGETQGEGDTAYEDPAEIAEKVTVKGLQGSDALTSIVLDGQGKEVGVYELVPSNAAVGEATGNYDITYVNGKLTITPTYTVTYRVVGGTWSDGTTADRTETVASGESPASVPTGMVASPGFTGGAWDNDPAGAAITGDATFTYAFEEVPKHTIRFVNEDGTELQSGLVAYGETPTYTGEPPTKPATAQFTYTFAGWTPEVVPVEADATYTATYEATPITATLTFDLAGGTLDGKTGTVTITANVGDTIAIPAAPTRKGYVFRYWKGSEYHPGDPYEVTGDHTFTAMWEKAADASPDQSGGKASPTTPATGDDSTMLVVALSVAALGLLCLLAALDVRCRAHRGRHSR